MIGRGLVCRLRLRACAVLWAGARYAQPSRRSAAGPGGAAIAAKGVELVAARGRGSGRTAPPAPARDRAPDGPDPGAPGPTGSAPAAGRPGLATLRQRLTEVVTPVADRAGVDLERLTISRLGRRHVVQVVVDRDGGVGLDAIAEVSRAVSTALDTAEDAGAVVIPGEYVLEVSSPGVDRPLSEPRHWRRSIGRLVSVPVAGEGQVSGRVRAADAAGVTLDVAGESRTLPYQRLGAGRVQVELQREEDS